MRLVLERVHCTCVYKYNNITVVNMMVVTCSGEYEQSEGTGKQALLGQLLLPQGL